MRGLPRGRSLGRALHPPRRRLPQRVPVEQALPVITSLLPEDIGPASTRDGENPPYAPAPGVCSSVVWTSPAIGDAVACTNPDWGTENEASAVLYSDRRTSDGSSALYDGTVRVAAIGFGDHNDVRGPVIAEQSGHPAEPTT